MSTTGMRSFRLRALWAAVSSFPRMSRTSVGTPSAWSCVLVAASMTSLLAFLWVSAHLPVPTDPMFQHLDGAMAATLDRVHAGGALYPVPSPESAQVEACYPYFPGILLVCVFLDRVAHVGGPVTVSRAVGLTLVFVLLAAVGAFCRLLRPGSLLGFAAAAFSTLLLLAGFCTRSPITVFPDFVVAGGLLAICTVIARMERDPAGPWTPFLLRLLALTASLVIAGLAKQNAASLFLGCGGYVLFCSRLPSRRRAAILLAAFGGAALVLAVVLAIPGAWMVTVRSIGAQAVGFTPPGFGGAFAELLSDYWLIGILVVLLASTPEGMWGDAMPGRTVSCFLWMWVPLLLLQTASRFKWGGGAHNFAAPILLLVPLLAARVEELLGRRAASRLANAFLALTAATAFFRLQQTLESLRTQDAEFERVTRALRQHLTQEPVVYDAALYPVLERSGVRTGVEWITLLHFLPVEDGRRTQRAITAVTAGDYAALVFPTYEHFYPRPQAYHRVDDPDLPWWISVWVSDRYHPQ